MMRFELRQTKDASFTLHDAHMGECYKSQHAARTESYEVFIRRGIEESPLLTPFSNFTVVELGFGLGTNLSCLLEVAPKKFSHSPMRFFSFEIDTSAFYYFEKNTNLPSYYTYFRESLEKRKMQKPFFNFQYKIIKGDFFKNISFFKDNSIDCIFYDPFSPRTSLESWEKEKIHSLFPKIKTQGRIVSYSVSNIAKDAFTSSGFKIKKASLPSILKKRESIIAIKE